MIFQWSSMLLIILVAFFEIFVWQFMDEFMEGIVERFQTKYQKDISVFEDKKQLGKSDKKEVKND